MTSIVPTNNDNTIIDGRYCIQIPQLAKYNNRKIRMTILTAFYLCMLGACFLVPIFFYFRMHSDMRRNRQLRDLEIASVTQAMIESSQAQHLEETRAARKKYREERRARIIQLFTPVRMILTEENFIRSETDHGRGTTQNITEEKDDITNEGNETPQQSTKIQNELEKGTPPPSPTMPNGGIGTSLNPLSPDSRADNAKEGCIEDDDTDDFVFIPKPGLPHGAAIYEFNTNTNSFFIANNNNKSNQQDTIELRKVPIECSICLCEYTVGSDIVSSSNPQCDHVFHTKCIEQWLMNQRDGPLCPCCRRDFVIDPFDLSGEMDDLEKGASNAFNGSSNGLMNASTLAGRRNLETSPISDDAEDNVVGMFLAASLVHSMARISESNDSALDTLAQLAAEYPNINGSSNSNSRT